MPLAKEHPAPEAIQAVAAGLEPSAFAAVPVQTTRERVALKPARYAILVVTVLNDFGERYFSTGLWH